MNATATAPRIPREQWAAHPRFRTQALLLGSHANFRRVSRYLVDKAAREELVGLHALFERWIAAMRSHFVASRAAQRDARAIRLVQPRERVCDRSGEEWEL